MHIPTYDLYVFVYIYIYICIKVLRTLLFIFRHVLVAIVSISSPPAVRLYSVPHRDFHIRRVRVYPFPIVSQWYRYAYIKTTAFYIYTYIGAAGTHNTIAGDFNAGFPAAWRNLRSVIGDPTRIIFERNNKTKSHADNAWWCIIGWIYWVVFGRNICGYTIYYILEQRICTWKKIQNNRDFSRKWCVQKFKFNKWKPNLT